LRGKVCGHGDHHVRLFIYVPQRLSVRSCEGASFEQVDQRVVRLDIPTPKGDSTWGVAFDRSGTVR
jgi:hypothetical protein